MNNLRNRNSLPWLLILGLALTGCTHAQGWLENGFKVGPNYARPVAPVAPEWIDFNDRRVIGEMVDDSQWWTVFNDPILNSLIAEAYQENLPLREAGLRVLEARAARGIAVGGLFPQQQQAFADYQRTQISKSVVPTNSLPPGIAGPRAFDLGDVGFDASWELDIWGRFRRNIESATADMDASIEDYDDILVTLIADVAATYIEVRTRQQQLVYARHNVEIQEGSLKLADVRFKNGATTELDVQQAKTNLANTEASIPSLEIALRQAENRLCILMGRPPEDLQFVLGKASADPSDPPNLIPTAPIDVAVGIPVDLLRRRPDIRRAERLVAAQSAQIGVAVADLFPSFTLIGSIGVESENLSSLFTGASTAGFLAAPSVRWNILNYGRIRNNIRVQDARFEQRVVAYEQQVLTAGQEVEDALVAFLKSQTRYKLDLEAVAAASRSVELVRTQYKDGAVDFNRVFTLESLLAVQQDNLAATKADIADGLIRVYKAMGGGWQIRNNPPPAGPLGTVVLPVPVEDDLPLPPLDDVTQR